MIKILFENSIFLHQKKGGVSKYIVNLNKKLYQFGIESKIFPLITINDYLKEKKTFYKKYIFGISSIPRFCRKFFFYLNDLFFLINIKIFKPDLIHFSFYNQRLIHKFKVPYVITIYDLIHEIYEIQDLQFSKKELVEGAKHIFCISKTTKDELVKIYNINEKKISVVYLGVAKKNNLDERKDNTILYVGDRGRYKNFESLLRAFGRSFFLKKNFKLICFGGGKFNSQEIELINELDIKNNLYQETGNDEKLNKFYSRASLYVSPSLMEGFGLTTLEAMSCSCPVLCSDIPIFREILGNCCEYFKPKDIEDIKDKLEKITKSQNEQQKLIKLGLNKVNEYSWEKCASQTSDIYKKLLNEK